MPTSPRPPRRPRRRAPAALVALAVGLGLVTAPIGADEIADTRAEAVRIADRIEELGHEAALLTEEYLEAQLAREQLDSRIATARQRARQSRADAEGLGAALRDFAVESYMAGGGAVDPGAVAVLGASDANEMGRRQGYARIVSSDGADLTDAYRGAAEAAAADARALEDLLAEAERVEAEIAQRRADTEARIAELEELEAQVTGRLRALVEAEQARREAERRRAAEEEARRNPPPAQASTPAPSPEAVEAPADEPEVEAPAVEPEPEPEPEVEADPADEPPPASEPDPETPRPPAGPASGAGAAIEAARSVLGVPYKWAGSTPSTGFDCSGLTSWAWRHGGKSLPHSSRAQYAMSRKIPVSQLQPGDLVFYGSPISHVGLYIGGGQMIHAPGTGRHVEVKSIYYWSALVGGGRI